MNRILFITLWFIPVLVVIFVVLTIMHVSSQSIFYTVKMITVVPSAMVVYALYPVLRILLAIAHTSLIMLIIQSGALQSLFKKLAAVGQMALTNYIMQTVICTLFFFGYGLNYYDTLQFYQIFYVVFFTWLIQLIISPLWLRYYRFGPLEWLWRSLTYWKIQPMRRLNKDTWQARDFIVITGACFTEVSGSKIFYPLEPCSPFTRLNQRFNYIERIT